MAFPAFVTEAPASGPVRRGLLAPGGGIPVEESVDADQEAGPTGRRAPRWSGPSGFTWDPVSCVATDPLPIVCPEGAEKPDGEDFLAEPRTVVAVALFGVDRCTVMGRPEEGRVPRARQALLDTQSHQLEREFWDGVASRAATPDLPNAYLASSAAGGATILSDDPVPYANALAELEQELAECLHGQQGMIHAMPYTVSMWMEAGLVRVEGQRLLTIMDTIVVTGSGYSGSAPGEDPGDPPVPPADYTAAAMAYASGLVYVRLGDIERVGDSAVQEIVRDTNDWVTRVERPAAAMWSGCCLLGIEVDHTTSTPGPA